MRSIETAEIVEKKRKRNQIIIGIILILIMFSSILGFSLFSRPTTGKSIANIEEEITYNGFKFVKNKNSLWQTEVDGRVILTSYNPEEVQDIQIDFEVSLEEINNQPFYYSGENKQAILEILYNFDSYIQRSQEVCLQGQECEKELVEKTCESNVIFFKQSDISENTNTYKQNKCIFIQGDYENQLKTVDRIIFKAFNIV